MFCPECGSKNQEDAVFCIECGSKLEIMMEASSSSSLSQGHIQQQPQPQMQQNYMQPQPQMQQNYMQPQPQMQQNYMQPQPQMQQNYMQPQPIVAKPSQPMSKKLKIIIGEIVVLCLALACLFSVAKKQYSPEKIAEYHFLKVMNGDWEGIYDDFDIVESEFISKTSFVNSKKYQGGTEYNTYKVNKADNNESTLALGATVGISYRLKGETENETFAVELNKQAGKTFLLFDTWKVNPFAYIREDYTITVPAGVKVVFNKVELGSTYLDPSSEDVNYVSYIIPELFQGEYELKLTQENMEDITDTISTYDDGFYISQMNLKGEIKEELVVKAGDTMKAIYDAGFGAASFDQIAGLFSANEETNSNMKNAYADFATGMGSSDGVGLQKVDFSNMTGSSTSELLDGLPCVYVTLNFDYTATHGAADWWTGVVTTETTSDIGSCYYTYVLEDGKWLLSSADFNVVYY